MASIENVRTLSFPILDGPSLMELMLAHYDPRPFDDQTDARTVEFMLGGMSPLFEDANWDHHHIPVSILGTHHKDSFHPVWSFRGVFHDSKSDLDLHVVGRINVKTRKGRIKFVNRERIDRDNTLSEERVQERMLAY